MHYSKAFIQAVAQNDLEKAWYFYSCGADPHEEDDYGKLPLGIAAKYGYREMVVMLLECGADPLRFDDRGDNAVGLAIYYNRQEVLLLLLQHRPEESLAYAIPHAAYYQKSRLLKRLLMKLPSPELPSNIDLLNEALLRVASPYRFLNAPSCIETVRLLVEYGADPQLILQEAALQKAPSLAFLLQEFGAIQNLLTAAALGDTDTARHLLEKGADIEATTEWDETPLILAARNGHAETVTLLLSAGADFRVSNANTGTPLDEAVKDQQWDAATVLCKSGAARDDVDALCHATAHEGEKWTSLLVRYGAPINGKRYDGKTPLMWAAHEGNHSALLLLLSAGADIYAHNQDGYSALMFAIEKDHQEIADLLLDAGADANTTDKDGFTPLMILAIHSDSVALAQRLLDAGASPNVTNSHGQTALGYADYHLRFEIATLLREQGEI